MTDQDLLEKYQQELKKVERKIYKVRDDHKKLGELQSKILNLEIEIDRKKKGY